MKKTALLLPLLLLSTAALSQSDADLSIDPIVGKFGTVQLGQTSNPITVTIKNEHATNSLVLGSASFSGGDTDQFSITNDNCSSQTVTAGNNCTLEVRYAPTKLGSRMAMLQISTNDAETGTLTAFFTNDEDNEVQAERRLPPVLFSLTIPETMDATTTYNLQWSLLGYHSSYSSTIALFDCTGKAAGTCGLVYSENFANSGIIQPTATVAQPTWTFAGEAANEFQYSYSFRPADHKSFPTGNTDIVVRFYRKNPMDAAANESSLSVLIPGNLSSRYYDDEGRRITKTVNVP